MNTLDVTDKNKMPEYPMKATAVPNDSRAFDVEIKKPDGIVKFRVLATSIVGSNRKLACRS